MKLIQLSRTAAIFCLFFLGTRLTTAEDIKTIHPSGYVTDLAGVIREETKARLEALCTELEQKTGAQMAIVTVHSLDGESVETYAVDLYKQLAVGSKKENRGVLLLVAPNERKYRIEVGYGLEPVINDARAGDAGRAMVPYLRQGNYSNAIETAAWQLAKYIADDASVTLSGQPPVRQIRTRGRGDATVGIIFFIVFFIILSIIGNLLKRGGGPRSGGGGGLLWFVLGLLAGSSGGRSGGSWDGGGFGGSSGGSGGGGFGGFGGGSSGGGGASGDW
ncbi:MAG TPA: TPM domain-containing protein [Candidatus Acidoferrum sp.]|nr:TPM domain-containing protein [Candidatus Acidoferrum sp.]